MDKVPSMLQVVSRNDSAGIATFNLQTEITNVPKKKEEDNTRLPSIRNPNNISMGSETHPAFNQVTRKSLGPEQKPPNNIHLSTEEKPRYNPMDLEKEKVFVIQQSHNTKVPLKRSMIAKRQQPFQITSTQRQPSQMAQDHLLGKTLHLNSKFENFPTDGSMDTTLVAPYFQANQVNMNATTKMDGLLSSSHSAHNINSINVKLNATIGGQSKEMKVPNRHPNVFIANAPSMLQIQAKAKNGSDINLMKGTKRPTMVKSNKNMSTNELINQSQSTQAFPTRNKAF